MIRDINKSEVLETAEYISREEALSVIANMQVEHHYDSANLEDRYVVAHLLEVGVKIKDLKTADVQPVKRGKWRDCKCNICNNRPDNCMRGDIFIERLPRYCPNCGADMEED